MKFIFPLRYLFRVKTYVYPSEDNFRKVKVAVTKDVVETSFEKWSKPGHFSRSLSKGPNTTTWIWNLHADAHDFDSHTTDLEDISRKIFSVHFGQLAIIEIWLSGMFYHGARNTLFKIYLFLTLEI